MSVRVPAPALVREELLPEMTPPTVRLPAVTVIVRETEAPRATVPLPRLKSFVPAKVKFPPQT